MSALNAEIAAEVESTRVGGDTVGAHDAAHVWIVSEIRLGVKGRLVKSGPAFTYPRLV